VCVRVCVSNCVCDLGTSNSHSSPQFCCSTTESNINFTYRNSNSNRRLLPAARQFGCFSRVDSLIRHISEFALRVESNHILTGILDGRDSHEAWYYAFLLRPLRKNKILITSFSGFLNVQVCLNAWTNFKSQECVLPIKTK
jgi:hypothetical protein